MNGTEGPQENEQFGEVKIADDVVAMIAGIAATEIDGVFATSGTISNELMSKVGMKTPTKGVKVDVLEKNVSVELTLVMEYGFNIPATCGKVQERVESSVENMTELTVTDVNIRIAGVNMASQKAQRG